MKELSFRTKQVIILLSKEKVPRSIGYISRKLNMLYPNMFTLADRMEFKHKLIKTTKDHKNGTRLILLTDLGKEKAKEELK